MTRRYCDGPTLLRAFASAVANLEAHAPEVDALNVFPVPDGDTGTNMLATVRSALAEAQALPEDDRTLDRVANALAFGALMGARGNSGVILSQVLRGMAEGAQGKRRANGLDLAFALKRGAETAYAAVAKPVEGTILTVVREAAQSAVEAGEREPEVESVLAVAVDGAARAVASTPSLLPVLRDAGVVDSGGQGLYLLLEGLLMDLATGGLEEVTRAAPAPVAVSSAALLAAGSAALLAAEALPEGAEAYGYETVYILAAADADLDPIAIRTALEGMGESVLVAGDARTVKIHVHNEHPDQVIAYGLSLGTLSRISVENLDQQAQEARERRAEAFALAGRGVAGVEMAGDVGRRGQHPHTTAEDLHAAAEDLHAANEIMARPAAHPANVPPAERLHGSGGTLADTRAGGALAVVAVAAGDGLARAFQSFGVAVVVRGGQGANPSIGELAEAIRAADSPAVIVLPNNPNVRLAAEQAGELTPGVSVEVVATRNAAEGIAAMLALDPRAGAEQNAGEMLDAARAIQSLQVTEAVRDATVGGHKVRRGQTMVLDPDDGLLASGKDRLTTTMEGMRRLRPAFELVTVYYGEGADLDEAERLAARIGDTFPGVDVELIHGGQPHYAYLIAAE